MRLIVHGHQAYGQAVPAAIRDKAEDEVVAVYCEPDVEGRPLDPFKEPALQRFAGLSAKSYKTSEVWEQMADPRGGIELSAYLVES